MPKGIKGFQKGHKNFAKKGYKLSEKTKKKISLANTGRIPWNKGTKGIVKAWNKGKKMTPLSEETKKKISEKMRKCLPIKSFKIFE